MSNKKDFIPVSAPNLSGNEMKYLVDCVTTNWISSKGKYVEKFEKMFAEYIGVKHAVAVSNGTVALHLALLSLDIGPEDEVIVPTLTYIASANAVKYTNARVVFADCEKDTWNISIESIKKRISSKTKAIIVVHLYGHPCDMDPIMKVAKEHNLYVIEDAAEAIGSQYKSKKVGGIGHLGTFSFYGNKTITTGEGGMVVTNDDKIAEKVCLLKGQGMAPDKRYYFPILGYNYRLTNMQASIGVAQMEKIDYYVKKKREIAKAYNETLGNINGITLPPEKDWAYNTYWMYSILIEENFGVERDVLRKLLYEKGIETRPFFYPVHTMPMYKEYYRKDEFPIANELSKKGINLPSYTKLGSKEISRIAKALSTF